MPDGTTADIGLVGEVETVNADMIRLLEDNGLIPVIAPVGVGARGESYNINADLVAGEVAAALRAEKLIHLTDVRGINGEDGRLVSRLTKRDAERLIKANVIDGGMLPKVESALRALEGGAAKAHIIDGRVPHAVLLEVFTHEGIGTEIVF
jgi:acetylglutamate kinase